MSDLQERLSRLSPEQRALLERLLRRDRAPDPASTIRPRPTGAGDLPASFGQQRLWFLDQMEPGRSTYNVFDTLSLDEPVDVAAVERSLNEIVRRHEVLRTTFDQRNHELVQIVAPALTIGVAVHDLTAVASARREEAAVEVSREFAGRPFDLARGPLLRAALVRSGDDDGLLLLSMHHIVTDAWSLEVFQREFVALYAAFRAGLPSPLTPLPIQFGDYAEWQRAWLTDDVRARELAHWTQVLAGAPQALDLPIAGPRPARPTYHGESQLRPMAPPLLAPLRTLAQAETATMFMATLAAFTVLLTRYTGQRDLVVGTPVACRDRAEVGGLIGFFVNTVVLRADLSGDPTFREVLRRTRDVCLAAFAHQDLPFEMVVEAVQPDRDPSRNPLFQITFQYASDAPADDDDSAAPDDLEPEAAVEAQPAAAKFDLAVNIWDSGSRLRAQADYSTDLFNAPAIARLLLHFERILEAAARQPDLPISRLPLLSDRERHDVVEQWNATATAYPRNRSLDDLFAAQVVAAPDAIAVVEGDRALTYAELHARAAALAHTLRARGVDTGHLVGVHMPRSADLIVAMLGIIQAGAAYVPLDPEYPAERLALMAADAALGAVVTSGAGAHMHFGDGCVTVSVPGPDGSEFAGGVGLVPRATPDSPAYVIYTSGSTGRPKGVVVTHRAVVRTVCNSNYLEITATDRVAQASNASFDAATFEIWGALLNGATLVVTPSELVLEPERLADRIRTLGLTVLFVTTAVLNQAAARAPRAFAGLRCLLFGGEAVDAGAVRRVLREGPPQRLLHVYGPTESTTFATFHPVTAVLDEASTVPIGRPLANTSVYLLDEAMQPVPVGVVGELYIGGDGLARGYLHDDALTAERFVPHPFAGAPARVYRTGDLARYLPDGAIEFVGRRDGQVKIRGFRIELGEVEALLREHPDVADVVAVCREETDRPKRLVAYVVARPERAAVVADLRAWLAQRAPAYMVPSAIVPLAALPLTANGKVHRAALPSPDDLYPLADSGDATEPRTPTEDAVARIFADVLGVEAIGIGVNFFESGGHSLLATQVVARVRQMLRVELPLRAVFTSQTAAALAAAIDAHSVQTGPAAGASIVRVSRDAYTVRRQPDGQVVLPATLKRLLHLAGS